jgi:hypothetical protein
VTYTGAGFPLLVLWIRNAAECGVCLVEELLGRRWCTECSCFSGMTVVIGGSE